MPTKKKRVGFIPREDVMKIIDKLSKENNLSNSKIISILVEEALSIRGIFNKKNGKLIQLYQEIKDDSQESYEDSDDFKDTDKLNLQKQINEEDFDLETYKKFISFLKFQEMIKGING